MSYTPPAPDGAHFRCDVADVLARIDAIDPEAYARTRNDLGGATTWLGPFLTHGVVDTSDVAAGVLGRHPPEACGRLLAELGWREFFHRTWQREGMAVLGDLHRPQAGVASARPPRAVLEARTGIDVVDGAIAHLLAHGTMHNHARLWTAAIACNLGRTAWPEPARWLHHHLLDGDLASNALSWQWTVGTFGTKRYVANQENVDRFSGTRQRGTWLDVPHAALDGLPVPGALAERADPELPAEIPGEPLAPLSGRVALRSIWDLDPRRDDGCERTIVFADTELLAAWPLSAKRWAFVEHWAGRCGATLVRGTVRELARAAETATLVRREYPACAGWPGEARERRWLFPMPDGPFRSFSRYWKEVGGRHGLR